MRILLFDTETTGLPKQRVPAKHLENNWPHIVSISWIIVENNVIIDKQSYIIKPNNWVIPPDSTAIHGITQEQAMHEGVSLEYAMHKFMYEPYDLMLAHNLDFDENVVVNAIYWDLNQKKFDTFPHPKRCTMRASTDICKLPGRYSGYKQPTLTELYKNTFGRLPDTSRLHGSLYDTEILAEIVLNNMKLREKIGLIESNRLETNAYQTKSNILRI